MNFRVLIASFFLAPAAALAGTMQELPGHGGMRVDGNLEISLADGGFFNPVALAPDFYYGFTKNLVFGLAHSANSQGIVGVGRSLQLKGSDDGYNGLNVEMYIPLLNTEILTIAPNAALVIDSMDPFDYSVKAGGQIGLTAAMVTIITAPHMVFPINNRSPVRDNILRIPVWLYYHWKGFMSLYILSGLNDGSLQLAPGMVLTATESIHVGAQYGWPHFAGDNNALDVTAFNLFAQFIF
jgi:hypothetical protein